MSRIEWTQVTWNPVTGCDTISPGCDHCYARALARRLKAMGNPKYQADGHPVTSGPGFAAAGIGRGPLPSPVLGGLLLTAAADGTLTAAAYDYEVSAQAAVTAETGEPGAEAALS